MTTFAIEIKQQPIMTELQKITANDLEKVISRVAGIISTLNTTPQTEYSEERKKAIKHLFDASSAIRVEINKIIMFN